MKDLIAFAFLVGAIAIFLTVAIVSDQWRIVEIERIQLERDKLGLKKSEAGK